MFNIVLQVQSYDDCDVKWSLTEADDDLFQKNSKDD